MATVIDLNAELATLEMLRGRTPQMTRAERAASSAQLAPYRDGAIFTTKFAGEGGWERHRTGDELVHIIDGHTQLYLMTEAGRQTLNLSAGRYAIVPQGVWPPVRCAARRDADDGDAAADRPSACSCRRSADARLSA